MAAFLYLVAVLIVFCLWSGMILCILAAFYMLTKWMGRSLYKRLRPRPLSEPQPARTEPRKAAVAAAASRDFHFFISDSSFDASKESLIKCRCLSVPLNHFNLF